MNRLLTSATQVLIASLTILLCGCGDSSGPGEAEDPGVKLAIEGIALSRLEWTGDGAEVVWASRTAINAVNPTTGSNRQLFSDPSSSIIDFALAGERIYFGAQTGTEFRVSRLNPAGGGAETLITAPWDGSFYVLVSDNERFLAANGALYDLQTGAEFDLPSGTARGFSPDGTQLLVQGALDDPFSFSLVSSTDGSSQPLQPANTGFLYAGHRWDGNSPQLLADATTDGVTRISEMDGLTGTTRDLAQIKGYPTFFLVANWSRDGRTLGAWLNSPKGSDPAKLFVIRSGSEPRVVASIGSDFFSGPQPPVFSPNGNSVAYLYDRYQVGANLYVKSGF